MMIPLPESKQHLFIYERKEMLLLVILCTTVSFFTFTLGVHFGKKVGGKSVQASSPNATLVKTMSDLIPNGQELTERGRTAQHSLDKSLNQILKDEVKQSGIKLSTLRQIELPQASKSKSGGATTIHKNKIAKTDSHGHTPEQASEPIHKQGSEHAPKNGMINKFTLQIGSYPTLQEAEKNISSLSESHLKGFLREAEISGKGKWYRVYLGEYQTRKAAEQAGIQYQNEHKISNFIVANITH